MTGSVFVVASVALTTLAVGASQFDLERIRADRAANPGARHVVRLAPGTYRLTQPICLGAVDSGLEIVAEQEGKTVFSGGVEIGAFKDTGKGWWEADATNAGAIEQLFVNDRIATPATSPNDGYFYVKDSADGCKDRFEADAQDIAPLRDLSTAELAKVRVPLYQSWDMGVSDLKGFDAGKNELLVSPGCKRPILFWNKFRPRYKLQNLRAAFDAPGEWYQDGDKILYIPREGESIDSTKAVAAISEKLLSIVGATNIVFRGVAFEHARLQVTGNGFVNGQAQIQLPAAVETIDSKGVVFDRCRFAHLGPHALWLNHGTDGSRVTHCLIEDLGAGGVYVGSSERKLTPNRASAIGNVIADNIIREGGRIADGAHGVWLGHTAETVVEHNEIGDFHYTGIASGWTWGYRPTTVRRNRIAWNHVHHIGNGILSDMAAIYTLGDHAGTEIVGNRIHDVWCYGQAGRGGRGIYTDEGSANIVIASNLVYEISSGQITQHYGKDNLFINNIFAFSRSGEMIYHAKVEKHHSFTFDHNIIIWEGAREAVHSWDHYDPRKTLKDVTYDHNLWWRTDGDAANDEFNHLSYKEWRKLGADPNGRIADPKFRDALKHDFDLAADSPAFALGFVPWDWRSAGVRGEPEWRKLADKACYSRPKVPAAPLYVPKADKRPAVDRLFDKEFPKLNLSGNAQATFRRFRPDGSVTSMGWAKPQGDDGTFVYQWLTPDSRITGMMWNRANPGIKALKFLTGKVRFFDAEGNPLPLEADGNGRVRLEIGQRPIYYHGSEFTMVMPDVEAFVHQFPKRVLYAKGGAVAGEKGRTKLSWEYGGEQPIAAYDFGGRTVGGYAVFKVSGFKAQGIGADGKTVGWPVVRLSYATHPDGLGPKGCFSRRGCAHYLGATFDNPVLPANVNRHETYTITHDGTYVAPLIQGQERYVRLQLDTPGTEVTIDSLEIRNVGVYSTEPRAGTFHCSDERVNRTWDMSVWTCQIASFPNNDAWRVVDGKLLPRKLERGTCAGLCEKAGFEGNGTIAVDFELRENPHHDSAIGLMLCAEGKDDGVVVVVSQPSYCQIIRRNGGVNQVLEKMVLDDRIIDGVPCRLEARVTGKMVAAYFNGEKIVEAVVKDLPSGDKFGFYVEKEWWPVVSAIEVKDSNGNVTFRDDFSEADDEGRLEGWDYTRSFKFIADGAKRDRLVWIGDLWWAERSCFYGYAPDWPYIRESLKLLCWYQTPEGYVWAAPFSEKERRPGRKEFGHFPSDEFSAWLVPTAADYYLYTADAETMKTVYPAVRAELGYLESLVRPDGLLHQRIETSSNINSMKPRDPTIRCFTHLVFWKAFTDGVWLANQFGHTEDAEKWRHRADSLAKAIRKNFWDEKEGVFIRRLKQAGTWDGINALAIGTGFATKEEALRLATHLAPNGSSKVQLTGIRGKFEYGFNEAAYNMLEGGTWFDLSDPSWEGAQCCTECGFMTRSNWWDESHPDTTAAGVISTYLLGVEPLEPGFRKFAFAPHFVERLTFAEGKVPTPHGNVEARWERKGDTISLSLVVPAGTEAELKLPPAKSVVVDGKDFAGGLLAPGRHMIMAQGFDGKIFQDASLLAGFVGKKGEQWFEAPPPSARREVNPDYEFPYVVDFGAVRNLLAVELTEAGRDDHPSEIRIDISTDGVEFLEQKELTGVAWAGEGKKIDIDLRTVGGALQARYLRLRMKHPPAKDGRLHGDANVYGAKFSKVRVKYLAE